MGTFSPVMEPGLFRIFRATVTGKDSLNRPVVSMAALPGDRIEGLLQQTGTVEGEAYVVDKFRAIMPINADLRTSDEVEARGDRYKVEGTPFIATVPRMPNVGVLTAVLKYVGPVT